MTKTLTKAEVKAAELEGFVTLHPITDIETLMKIENFQVLKQQIEILDDRRRDLRDELLAEMEERNATQGFLAAGKPIARRSEVHSVRVDTARLRAEKPEVFAEYSVASNSVRLVIPKKTA